MTHRFAVTFGVALVFLVGACGGSSSGSGVSYTNDGCTLAMSGTYTATYTVTSGNCGPVGPVHLTIDATPGSPTALQSLSSSCPDGSGSEVATPASGGGCTLRGDFSGCKLDGQTFDLSSDITWTSSYTSATGTQSFTVEGACSGTYAVSISAP